MDIVTIDLETFYSQEFSFAKQTTEEYIRDPRFEVIGVGVKLGDDPTIWYSGDRPDRFLSSLDFSNKAVLAHNCMFDAAVLSWHYGIKPARWLDTLSMARPVVGARTTLSLARLAEFFGLGVKGDEVYNAKGKRRADFTPEELNRYAEYCINDVDLTYELYQRLIDGFPEDELRLIDMTIRMFAEPVFTLDASILREHLGRLRTKKINAIHSLDLDEDVEEVRGMLMSNPKFAELLRSYGVEPPMKTSTTTGESTYAFAKTDGGFLELLNHEDERVKRVATARLETKSTLEETRTERFIGVAERGPLPVALNYYGAHTGRFSGGDKQNLQNLPRTSPMRAAMRAPEEHKLVICDLSQIEARMVAWLADQEDLLASFEAGDDVYSQFATKIYSRPITKADKVERFVGKTCVAEGTPVLTQRGWVPIEQVTLRDKLWDGEEWVCHQGLVKQGTKKTLPICGTWLTPDHLVWSGTQWLSAASIATDESTLSQALGIAAENLPSQGTYSPTKAGRGCKPSSSSVTVMASSTPSTDITSKISNLLDAVTAATKLALLNTIGRMRKLCQRTSTVGGCLTESVPLPRGATTQKIEPTNTTAGAASMCMNLGEEIKRRSSLTSSLCLGGMLRSLKWIGSTWMGGMNPATSDSHHDLPTYKINDGSQTYSCESPNLKRSLPVYDIANAGPRTRFTILTERGPLIVHNCILSLQYGVGWRKFKHMLSLGGVEVDEGEARSIVSLYRSTYPKIPQLWDACNDAILGIYSGEEGHINNKPLTYSGAGIRLPSGFLLQYPALRMESDDEGVSDGFTYIAEARAYLKDQEVPDSGARVRLYGAKVTENISQALARIVMTTHMLKISEKYRIILQVHDEVVVLVPEADVRRASVYVENVMSTPPEWAPTLPVACEYGVGDSFGEGH